MTPFQKIDKLLVQHQIAVEIVDREISALAVSEEQLADAESARSIVQQVGQAVQQEVHQRLSALVTRCLQLVFGDAYEFRLEFDRKRNRTEAVSQFIKDGVVVDPMTASGGGVVDVASFALRLSAVLMTRPPLRRLLVLDEPFRFVSAEYRPKVRALVDVLSKETGVQIILVTHLDSFKLGTEVRL